MDSITRQLENFDLEQIANSGQCFRFKKIGANKFQTVHLGRVLKAEKLLDGTFRFYCTEQEWNKVWLNYFDLNTDYSEFSLKIKDCNMKYVVDSYEFSKGIRILNQEPFEMLISYIISQRNRIERISNCVEKLSERYGKEIAGTGRYSFPTADELSLATREELTEIGLGYRVDYVLEAAKLMKIKAIDFEVLKTRSYENQLMVLTGLKGVGPKVANCVILFGLHNLSAFPIDVWIERILSREFGGYMDTEWCKKFAGVVQQYMFYYERNK